MLSPANNTKETSLIWLTLFATTGTLVCCALPIALVTLGLGAAVATLVGALPFLVTLSKYKILTFLLSGALLTLAGTMIYRPGRNCPTDSKRGLLCTRSQLWNRRVFWLSILLWGIGFFTSFLVLPLQLWIEP